MPRQGSRTPSKRTITWEDLRYPQPGFFETTVVTVESPGAPAQRYDAASYEQQRTKVYGDLAVLKEHSFEALLSRGWVPHIAGCLVDPDSLTKKRTTIQVDDAYGLTPSLEQDADDEAPEAQQITSEPQED